MEYHASNSDFCKGNAISLQRKNSVYSIRHFRESDFPALDAFYNQIVEGWRVIRRS